jgi:hypothetical protein
MAAAADDGDAGDRRLEAVGKQTCADELNTLRTPMLSTVLLRGRRAALHGALQIECAVAETVAMSGSEQKRHVLPLEVRHAAERNSAQQLQQPAAKCTHT